MFFMSKQLRLPKMKLDPAKRENSNKHVKLYRLLQVIVLLAWTGKYNFQLTMILHMLAGKGIKCCPWWIRVRAKWAAMTRNL